jgi:hypothetical protein
LQVLHPLGLSHNGLELLLNFRHSSIYNNSAGAGGGMAVAGTCTAQLYSAAVRGNHAYGSGDDLAGNGGGLVVAQSAQVSSIIWDVCNTRRYVLFELQIRCYQGFCILHDITS